MSDWLCFFAKFPTVSTGSAVFNKKNKKAVLPQGNRAMPQLFFSV